VVFLERSLAVVLHHTLPHQFVPWSSILMDVIILTLLLLYRAIKWPLPFHYKIIFSALGNLRCEYH
jgi:hypothetical protein